MELATRQDNKFLVSVAELGCDSCCPRQVVPELSWRIR